MSMVNGIVGEPRDGFVRLRIKSRWDPIIEMNITQVFAVAFDGTETEVQDIKQASWKHEEGIDPPQATVEVYGAELDADAGEPTVKAIP